MATKRLRTGKKINPVKYWDSLPWKSIDTANEDLGDFEETVFFGLEEVDGSAYISSKTKKILTDVADDTVNETEAIDVSDISKDKSTKKTKRERKLAAGMVSISDVQDVVHDDVIEMNAAAGDTVNSDEKLSETGKKAKRVLTTEQKIEKYRVIAERKLKFKKQKEVTVDSTTSTDVVTVNKKNNEGTASGTAMDESADWGGIKMNALLYNSLIKLSFSSPTPIQLAAIPRIIAGGSDIVGAAETGSGKTLAFGLPIIHSLMMHWEEYGNVHTPYALIIAPTRELAMQITTVLKDVCADFKKHYRIEVVTIVGGMSEQKQRRQLVGGGKPLHIVVATPGRLVEIFNDETVLAFQDMSGLKFLVVDEADRIMEDGHFAELHRVFSRICDHEKLAQSGQNPIEVARLTKAGTMESGDLDVPLIKDDPYDFDQMPSEEQIRAARAAPVRRENDDEEGGNAENTNEKNGDDDEEEEMMDIITAEPVESDDDEATGTVEEMQYQAKQASAQAAALAVQTRRQEKLDAIKAKKHKAKLVATGDLSRQTLLFSATAVQAPLSAVVKGKKGGDKNMKLNGTLMGIGQNGTLPEHMKKLLSMVAVQKVIHAIDVTAGNLARRQKMLSDKEAKKSAKEGGGKTGKDDKKDNEDEEDGEEEEEDLDALLTSTDGTIITLPKGLTQFEIRVPTEEKDVFAYYYLLKHAGRSLLFVNSIKTARRVDGLLRALGINCRTIHAQLQQRQRLRALESFRSSPIGVLVATDVAARGLDIPKVQSVIHYDIARSPQVYIHRSGRTARAGSTGTSVSLPSPEDATHHKDICDYLSMVNSSMPLLNVELSILPMLRDRVKLAKKIFTQSFVASQSSKDNHWLQQNADQADLEIDEYLQHEVGDKASQKAAETVSKKALEKAKYELRQLLETPLEDSGSVKRSGRGFFVFAK